MYQPTHAVRTHLALEQSTKPTIQFGPEILLSSASTSQVEPRGRRVRKIELGLGACECGYEV